MCKCTSVFVREKERERERRRAQVTAAYAKHSENIHSAFGEQGTRYALGIQFRLWLKAMSWLCVWLSMSGSVCSLHLSFFFLDAPLKQYSWWVWVALLHPSTSVSPLCLPAACPLLLRLSLLLQAWPALQIPSPLFGTPILNRLRCFIHQTSTFADWYSAENTFKRELMRKEMNLSEQEGGV